MSMKESAFPIGKEKEMSVLAGRPTIQTETQRKILLDAVGFKRMLEHIKERPSVTDIIIHHSKNLQNQ